MIVYALLCRQQQLASYITLIILLQMQDAIVCSKMDFYTLLPMIFAVVANCMRKDLLVWSAKAGYDLLALEIRMWELLPASLMVAMIFALVVEVWHPCFTGLLLAHIICAYCRPNLFDHLGHDVS